ncbi:MAG: tetratricopeptide repeat protein [Deltaproteobacteria bacterium]|nr:tetratricopeptide repeat protein [Deltaproteobacteria bacterium]
MSPHAHEPCPEHVDALDRVIAGAEPDAALETHMAGCSACRRYAGRLQGLEEFLREAHAHFDELEPGALDEPRRAQPAKIAAWAAGVIIVAGMVAGIALTRDGVLAPTPTIEHTPVAMAEPVEGRVILASGLPAVLRQPDGSSQTLELGAKVGAGQEIVVSELGSIIVRFPSGLTLLAGSSSRLLIEEASDERQVLRLEDGSLVVRAGPGARAGSLLVRVGDSTVEPRGRTVAMRAALGSLTEVTAVSGRVRVVLPGGKVMRVAEGTRTNVADGTSSRVGKELTGSLALLDLLDRDGFRSTLTVLSDLPSQVSVDGRSIGSIPLTVLLTEGRYSVSVFGQGSNVLHQEDVEVVYGRESLVVVEAAMAGLDEEPGEDVEEDIAGSGKAKVDIVARIREALAAGDTDEALALVEKHIGARKGDPAFMSAAADTYRKLGRYGDSVDAYLVAAVEGKGKAAEKAYLAAARITLEKLRDPGRAQLILSAYWKGYPDGFYEQEASFLEARLLFKQKKHAQARQKLEALLASSPKGYMATKAHLLLGSILAAYMGDCAAAMPHLKAVQKAAPGGKFADEAARFMGLCNGQ